MSDKAITYADEFEKSILTEAVEHFNERRFFEAHEVLEPIWLKSDEDLMNFYRGLIRVSLCFRNLETNNFAGARYLIEQGSSDLETFSSSSFKGLDLQGFLKGLQSAQVMIEELERSGAEWDFEQTPKIPLAPEDEPAAV